jgi:hypothetical protein
MNPPNSIDSLVYTVLTKIADDDLERCGAPEGRTE